MSTEIQRWEQVNELFTRLVTLSPDERLRELDRVAPVPEVRREVEQMLDGWEAEPHLSQLVTVDRLMIQLTDLEIEGPQIAGYEVGAWLGDGGMGVVYRAKKLGTPPIDVVVKVIRAGHGAPQVIERFDNERHTLASLDHPNVARIYDGGETLDGMPFFAMGYIDGVPFDEFCRERQLDLERRLRLFLPICAAVQYAHQKGVIHRDLKPTNILVTDGDDGPIPVVIDFGIAKAVDDGRTLVDSAERTGVFGTPGYMSPEQYDRSGDVDTRTDIYALGVMIFESVTGTRPFAEYERVVAAEDHGPTRRALRAAMAGEPPAPSARVEPPLRRRLQGDLDAIVRTCLDPERDRRYESVGALAADLRRYLRGEPVSARDASRAHRVRLFVRRNRLAVGAATAISLLAVIAGALAIVNYIKEIPIAEAEARELTSTASFEKFDDIDEALTQLERATNRADWLPGPVLETIRALLMTTNGRAQAELLAKDAYERFPNNGEAKALRGAFVAARDPQAGELILQDARELLETSVRSVRRAEARIELARGLVASERDEKIRHLKISRSLYPWSYETVWQLAQHLFTRGSDRLDSDEEQQLALGLKDLEESRTLARRMTDVRDELSMSWVQLGSTRMELARSAARRWKATEVEDDKQPLAAERDELLAVAEAAFETALERDSSQWRAPYNIGLIHMKRWNIDPKKFRGELAKAGVRFKEARTTYMNGVSPGSSQRELPKILEQLRGWHHDSEKHDAALELADQIIELADGGLIRYKRAMTLRELRRWDDAFADMRVAVDSVERGAAIETEPGKWHEELARLALVTGEPELAEQEARTALEIDSPRKESLLVLAELATGRGQVELAQSHFDAVLAMSEDDIATVLHRGAAMWRLGQLDQAVADIRVYVDGRGGDWAWVALWGWAIEKRRGRDAAASRAIRPALGTKSEWLAGIPRALSNGEPVDFEANRPDDGSVEARLYPPFYAGLVAWAEGRDPEAIEQFRRSTEIDRRGWLEHRIAAWLLSELS